MLELICIYFFLSGISATASRRAKICLLNSPFPYWRVRILLFRWRRVGDAERLHLVHDWQCKERHPMRASFCVRVLAGILKNSTAKGARLRRMWQLKPQTLHFLPTLVPSWIKEVREFIGVARLLTDRVLMCGDLIVAVGIDKAKCVWGEAWVLACICGLDFCGEGPSIACSHACHHFRAQNAKIAVGRT